MNGKSTTETLIIQKFTYQPFPAILHKVSVRVGIHQRVTALRYQRKKGVN